MERRADSYTTSSRRWPGGPDKQTRTTRHRTCLTATPRSQQDASSSEDQPDRARATHCTVVFDCSKGDGVWGSVKLTSSVKSKQKTLWNKAWSSSKHKRRLNADAEHVGHMMDADAEHVGHMADERRQLGVTRKTIKLLPTKCIPTPIWGLRICFGSNFFYEYGARTSFGASGLTFEPYATAGIDGHASLNVFLGEIGLYVQGEFFRLSLPFKAQFSLKSMKDVCMRMDAVSNGFAWESGFYYRLIRCRFKWCCRLRCRMGGRRSVGRPTRRSFGRTRATLFNAGC